MAWNSIICIGIKAFWTEKLDFFYADLSLALAKMENQICSQRLINLFSNRINQHHPKTGKFINSKRRSSEQTEEFFFFSKWPKSS